MSLPMLQVALDNQTMDSAYETTRLIAEEVDIIEVGTILCVGEGVRAVRDLKALYPHKIVLADAKIADAGKILSRMCFEANADWVTVICCADINTAKGALDVAKEFNGDVQIELTGYWTWEQAQQWRDAGIQQVVYHRSRDAQAAGVAWGEADITAHIDHHHIVCFHGFVGDAAGLDHHQPAFAVDGADVAPGKGHQPVARQIHVGFKYLLFQLLHYAASTMPALAMRAFTQSRAFATSAAGSSAVSLHISIRYGPQ